jgi:glucans biosynthesis protein C
MSVGNVGINGFFAILMLEKYSVRSFILNRLHRIGVPFLLGMLLLIPYILTLGFASQQGIEMSDALPQILMRIVTQTPTFAHLWSLWYLLIIYLILVVLFQYKSLIVKEICIKMSLEKALLFVALGASFSMFFFYRKYTLLPLNRLADWQMILYYFSFFCLGIWFYFHKNEVEKIKIPRSVIVITIISIVINVWFQKVANPIFSLHFFGVIAYALQGLGTVVLLFQWMKNATWGSDKFLHRYSQSMYWMFWIEVPIAITIHYLGLNLLNPLVIVLGGTLFTLLFSYFSYIFFLEKTNLGKILGFSPYKMVQFKQ